ncbi:uncharacterized protein EI90DRAFT_3029786 [Cantharellus anzutake]|uniref:uncharacterized protein n=1 Tax=Cantharellus anzutake TaxID=1750568 RepID=UPI001904B4D0|nr:uncharacterized protein EI90DRAFT_3029786 [Cantharellus anzutake]KAF8342662.1 hypothetical protein EI90DRAFT_3029786 [Cantharellus anzutake]
MISFACVVFCVGSFIQTVAPSLSVLGLGRFVGGIGIGSLSLSIHRLIGASPPETRGTILSIEQFSIVLGVVFGFWFGFITRTIPGSWSWRLPLVSPRYLIASGADNEAARVLRKLRNASNQDVEELIQIELLEMRVETTLNKQGLDQDAYRVSEQGFINETLYPWLRLFEPRFRRQTLLGITIMFFQQFSGINAVLYFGPRLMVSLGVTGDTIILVSSGFASIMQLAAVTPAIIFIDRLGRRPLLMAGSLIMAAAHGLIAGLVWCGSSDWRSHQSLAGPPMIYVYVFGYGMSFGPIGWVLPNEIFPLTVRSHGVGLSTASNWLNNFIIGLICPALISASPVATFLLFTFSCAAAFFWSLYVVPETRGISLEEMDALFESEGGQESMRAKEEIEVSLGLPQLVQRILDS